MAIITLNNNSLSSVTSLPTSLKGMDRLATTAVSSAVASVTFDVNHNDDSTFNNYSHYVIYAANVLCSSSSADTIRIRIGVSNSSDIKTDTGYFRNSWSYKPNATTTLVSSSALDSTFIAATRSADCDNSTRPQFGEIHFYKKGNNASTMKPSMYGQFFAENTGGYFNTWKFQGSYETAVDTNYVQISYNDGNITKGDFTLMGVRNS